MSITIQIRRGTAAEWTAANPVLASGELGLETDTGKIKVGDGIATWNSTVYNVSSGNTVADITVGADAAASGTGGISYDGATATLTYTPPDFATQVANNESVTSLSLGANTLTYTDEAGTVTNLDLSLYLDDTNLARIISGTIDDGTGIATFERDDSTTFTVDMSALFDDTNLARITTGTFNTGTGDLTLTRNDATTAATISLDGRYLTAETNDLSSVVTWANVPDANITESSVTQHQGALSINESQIVFTNTFIVAGDLSVGTPAAASGNGSVSYDSGTGVFTYTPPDIPSLETTTSISFAGTTITYNDEDGVATNLDISSLDRARVNAANFDTSQGILTLTRDDATTMTANFDGRYIINEIDPVFVAHTAYNIADGTGFLKNDNAGNWFYDMNTYLTTEVDPVFTAHTSSSIINGTGFLKNDGAGGWSYDNNTYLTNINNESINELSDVTITSAEDRQVLIYNNSTSTWENGQQTLEDQSNVTITNPTQGEGLLWNPSTSQWVNGTVGNWTGYIDGGSSISIYNSGDFLVDGGNA